MTKYKVVLVDFPDITVEPGVRPALCLSEPMEPEETVIVAFISSSITRDPLETDILLKESSGEFRGTGLLKDGMIRLHTLTSIPVSLIKRQLGVINTDTRERVTGCLDKIFHDMPGDMVSGLPGAAPGVHDQVAD